MQTLINLGYFGLFIGSFAASTIIPFSSDAVYLGMLALGSNMWICLIVGTLGNWAGEMTSYAIGYAGNLKRIEKRFKISAEKLEKQKPRIDKYGQLLSFFSWLPIVGDLFALALGFFKVSPKKTALWMFVGRGSRFVLWNCLYIWVGERFVNFILNL